LTKTNAIKQENKVGVEEMTPFPLAVTEESAAQLSALFYKKKKFFFFNKLFSVYISFFFKKKTKVYTSATY